jgi:hypothetical protein
MGVQAFQLSSEPFDLSRGNKAYIRRTMEDSFGIGGYRPSSLIIVRDGRAFCRRPSFPVIERNIKCVENRWSRSVVSDSQFHFIVYEWVTSTHVELEHSQSRYGCASADIGGLFQNPGLFAHMLGLSARHPSLPEDSAQREQEQPSSYSFRPCQEYVPPWRFGLALICILAGAYFAREGVRSRGWIARLYAFYVVAFAYCVALLIVNGHQNDCDNQNAPTEYRQSLQHGLPIVPANPMPADFKLGHYRILRCRARAYFGSFGHSAGTTGAKSVAMRIILYLPSNDCITGKPSVTG